MTDIPTDKILVRTLAEKAMGWEYFADVPCPYWLGPGDKALFEDGDPKWDPLTDANDMLMVIEAMHAKHYVVTILFGFGDEPTLVTMERWIDNEISAYAEADTAQRAVCEAAFEALAAEGNRP